MSSADRLPLHGFLGGSTFASYHAPVGPVRNAGWVICPPLGYEAIQCYHTLIRLAQNLAASGIHTLRIEYNGTGESLGSDRDPDRVPAWLDSIRCAVEAVGNLEHVDAVGLIGMRVGALLAARVATELDIASMVLWEPCLSGTVYTRELEILASASLDAILARDAVDTSVPDGVVAAGYLLTRPTIDDLNGLTVTGEPRSKCRHILIVERDDRPSQTSVAAHFESLGCETTVERRPGYREMMTAPAKSRVPLMAIDGIRDWVVGHSRLAGEAPGGLALDSEATDGPRRVRPIRFGSANRLFGVVTEPSTQAADRRAAVLFLAGGVVPRTAVNRMYVACANRLADLGHPVLRMDVSGIGESPPADGAEPNDAYAPSLLDDVRSALHWITSHEQLSDEVWLIGLCSGAYAAFQIALEDPKVVGSVLINPLVLYWSEGMTLESPSVQQLLSGRQHRSALLSASSWKRLLTGSGDVRRVSRILAARGRAWVSARWTRVSSLLGMEPGGVSTDLGTLCNRGVTVAFAFSEGDPGHDALVGQLAGNVKGLERRGVALRIFPGADHTFSELGVRDHLLDWVVGLVSEDQPSALEPANESRAARGQRG